MMWCELIYGRLPNNEKQRCFRRVTEGNVVSFLVVSFTLHRAYLSYQFSIVT